MKLLNPENPLITTLEKALDEIDPDWGKYKGLIVPGSWPGQDDEKFIETIIPRLQKAKEEKVPYLGICLGMQAIGVMEGGKLEKMSENRVGIFEVQGWWGTTHESHWHRFKVVGDFPEYDVYETDGIIEAMKLRDSQFFVGVQFHPEYQNLIGENHPILREFLYACRERMAMPL